MTNPVFVMDYLALFFILSKNQQEQMAPPGEKQVLMSKYTWTAGKVKTLLTTTTADTNSALH